MNDIKIYVITLKNKNEYVESNNFKSLSKLKKKIILSKGVILNKEQQDKYFIYCKSSIGISLAHIKVWKKIIKKTKEDNYFDNFSIILEDDTQLNIDVKKFNEEIKNIINNYKFDIYKLHSDFDNGFTSMAGYIINHKSIDKLLNKYVTILGQIDFDLFILNLCNKITIITHTYNLFTTDESESTNRKDKYNILKFMDNIKLSKRSDKNLKHYLTYKVFKIFNYETIVYEILLFVLLVISMYFKLKYLFFIIIILLIL